ncbi:hypothetical protein [uncultured Algoriphagus sp.]|uniref:hypothetical protein n=1 Tax=uncultured Algoriphagus sp. TaxID=417365 RepID=UPI0030EF29DA|tara:strand:- start:23 stop:511 length:489 start_codon:yes stop_codon:yes gene_type:complete
MKKILKTAAVLSVLIVAISACQQQGDVSKMLENEESRNQLYETIISDNEHSKQLMQAMMEDDHTLMMMKDNGELMSMMMSNNENMMGMMKDNPEMTQGMMSNMMSMAESDSSVCKHMISLMKDRPNVMGQMMDMMHNEGMMDKETMMRNREKMGIENHGDHH